MGEIRVPERVIKGFTLTSNLNRKNQVTLLDSIKECKIGVKPELLLDVLKEKSNIKERDLVEIVKTVFSIVGLTFNSQRDTKDIAEDLFESLQLTVKSVKLKTNYKEFLRELLDATNTDSFHITNKAYDLAYDRSNILYDSKIVSDIRPVFGGKDDLELKATSAIFNLQLNYSSNGGHSNDSKRINFALDINDLKLLKEQIIRAEKKAQIIEDKFSEFNLIEPSR